MDFVLRKRKGCVKRIQKLKPPAHGAEQEIIKGYSGAPALWHLWNFIKTAGSFDFMKSKGQDISL